MSSPLYNLASLQRSETPIARSDSPLRPGASLGETRRSEGPDFAKAFAEAIGDAGAAEQKATDMSVQFADGDPDVGIHDVVIASERANISLRYTVTLKNKLLEAYRDIMSTQV